jgi:hypothetical protein
MEEVRNAAYFMVKRALEHDTCERCIVARRRAGGGGERL